MNMKKNVCVYLWITLPYTRNWYNIVNQHSSIFLKKGQQNNNNKILFPSFQTSDEKYQILHCVYSWVIKSTSICNFPIYDFPSTMRPNWGSSPVSLTTYHSSSHWQPSKTHVWSPVQGQANSQPKAFILAVLLAEKALPPHPSYHTGLISLSLIETLPHSTPLSQPPSLLSLFALVFFLLFANTFCETLSSTQGMNESTTNESVIHSFNHSIPSFLPWKSMYLPDPEDKMATMVRSLPSQIRAHIPVLFQAGKHTATHAHVRLWRNVEKGKTEKDLYAWESQEWLELGWVMNDPLLIHFIHPGWKKSQKS